MATPHDGVKGGFFELPRLMNMPYIAEKILAGLKRRVRHPLARGGVIIAASQFITAGLGFITNLIVARVLGPTEYGLVALVVSYPNLLMSLVAVKSGSITTRYMSGFRATRQFSQLRSICKVGYAIDLSVSFFVLALVVLTGWWAVRFLHGTSSGLMIAYAASFPLLSFVGTSNAVLTCLERFNWLGRLQIVAQGIESFVVINLVLSGFGVSGVVLGMATGNLIIGTVSVGLATYALWRENIGSWWSGSLGNLATYREELMRLFGWNYLAVTCAGLLAQLPLMLLGALRGPAEAGFYRLATTIVTAGSYLETSMATVAYPVLSARWTTRNRHAANADLRRWTLTSGLPVGAVVLVGTPFLPLLISLIFGAQYEPMASGVQIMMLANAFSATFFWVNAVYYASGKVALWTIAYGVQTLLVIGLAWFCIDHWGFWGLALLTTAGKVAFTIAMVLVFRKVAASPQQERVGANYTS